MSLSFASLRRCLPLLLLSLSGCSPSDSPATAGLVYCSEGNPESFNPQRVTSGTTIDATSHQIYDRLINFDMSVGDYVPGLAVKWDISEDGLVYRFQLRQNVDFHQTDYFTPTRRFNADDVLFSFDRIRQPSHPFYLEGTGQFPFFESVQFAQQIEYIKALGPYEVEFKLAQPDVTFMANLATDFAVILSGEYGDTLQQQGNLEALDQLPVGTGPFKLHQYAKNQYIRYQRHDKHWRGPVENPQLVFDISPNSTTRLTKLITNECDISALPNSNELSVLGKYPQVRIENQPGLNVAFWALNTQKPPFHLSEVRQALAHAINKEAILKVVYNNTAIQSRSLLPPFSWAYSPSRYGYEYDPNQAIKLLRAAGVEELEMDIWTVPVARAYNPNSLKTAELIQADLARVGITANIITYDWSVFNQKMASNEYDSVVIGWNADNTDPDNFFTPLLSCNSVNSGNNRARWCNETFDWLVQHARQTTDLAERKALYRQAERLIAIEAPLISLAHTTRQIIRHERLEGLKLAPFGGLALAGAVKTSDDDDDEQEAQP
ncbi:ABC transporter substrate-binding protein [Paraferrimonas sedimenticola]|uniref:ABC transporter substrate-binding protein n=1 Tax=Paraferrimonas sedimenticola TaxID=375674 RepID=A0AA37VSD6_9GAMM|nr:ABC transporter substrate-binding protein [Paraferrimonas sedimenticola]GLP94839.1 ABC transporter substrate-binding protein [Paraferrimonas sedimenticola]